MEATPESTAEGMVIVRVLAAVLDRLVNANAPIARADPGQVTKFHAMKAPGISILQYLERIHKYASCSNECFILALIYIDRLIQRSNFLLTELNVHRVVITSVLLGAKFFDDAYYNNAYYAKVGGVLVSEMNGLEVDFLFRINFSLHVTPDVFDKYRAELVMHSQAVSFGLLPVVTQSPVHAAVAAQSPLMNQQLYAPTMQHTPIQPQHPFGSLTTQPLRARPPYTSMPNTGGCGYDFRVPQQITPSPPNEPEELQNCDPNELLHHGLANALKNAVAFDSFFPAAVRAQSLPPLLTHTLATTSTPPYYVPHHPNPLPNTCAQDNAFIAAAFEEQALQQQQQHHYVIVDNHIFPLQAPMHGGYSMNCDGTSSLTSSAVAANSAAGNLHHVYAQQLMNPLVGARILAGISGAGL